MDDEALERLIGYDGVRYWLSNGWSLRFTIRRVAVTSARPHGTKHAFNLHDAAGERLLGFDNAHPVEPDRPNGHSHRFRNLRRVEFYAFRSADDLITDFFGEVERACVREGQAFEFVGATAEMESDHDDD